MAIVCDDGDACTTDTCNVVKGCVYTPVSVSEGNQCLGIYCDSIFGIIELNTVCPYSCNPSYGCNVTINATTSGLTNGGATTNGGASTGATSNGGTTDSATTSTTGVATSTVTFTFTSPNRVDESLFVSKMATVLGISESDIAVISYSVSLNNKRAEGYSVEAVFEILGPQGSQKAAELQVKVTYSDPSLADAGFNEPTISVKQSTTSTTTTTASGDGDEVSAMSKLELCGYVLACFVIVLL